ncbi:MAG: CrcB family protein [Thermomicrobiales bacterium]
MAQSSTPSLRRDRSDRQCRSNPISPGHLAVNLLGSLVIGFFFRYWRSLPNDRRPDLQRLFFTTGVLGGFTTFSTLSLDSAELFRLF